MSSRKHRSAPPSINYPPGLHYPIYAPAWNDNFHYMTPGYVPNYQFSPNGNYYPQPQPVPPYYAQPRSTPYRQYPGQPPYYIDQGPFMPGQPYPPHNPSYHPGQNYSRSHRSEAVPHYGAIDPEWSSHQQVPPPTYQPSSETYQRQPKKTRKSNWSYNKQYPQPPKAEAVTHEQPAQAEPSPKISVPESNKKKYKNWQDYKNKK